MSTITKTHPVKQKSLIDAWAKAGGPNPLQSKDNKTIKIKTIWSSKTQRNSEGHCNCCGMDKQAALDAVKERTEKAVDVLKNAFLKEYPGTNLDALFANVGNVVTRDDVYNLRAEANKMQADANAKIFKKFRGNENISGNIFKGSDKVFDVQSLGLDVPPAVRTAVDESFGRFIGDRKVDPDKRNEIVLTVAGKFKDHPPATIEQFEKLAVGTWPQFEKSLLKSSPSPAKITNKAQKSFIDNVKAPRCVATFIYDDLFASCKELREVMPKMNSVCALSFKGQMELYFRRRLEKTDLTEGEKNDCLTSLLNDERLADLQKAKGEIADALVESQWNSAVAAAKSGMVEL